ncbi:MAG: glutamine-hydrolyzing GMP synthase [Fidelibacterota bacterium]
MNNIHHGGVVILDFGSQYTQLIARRIREQNVFSIIYPADVSVSEIMSNKPKAMILSGGPSSVFAKDAPVFDPAIFDIAIPILGVCYGLQLLALQYNGIVEPGTDGEYGFANIHIKKSEKLLNKVDDGSQVWMSHMDKVTTVPKGWSLLAESSNNIVAAMCSEDGRRYATQFHPEVAHTTFGERIIHNFLFHISECNSNWTPGNFIQDQIKKIKNQVGNKHVICGVSGGVDSSVVAALMHKAIGDQCNSVLIDHGLLRKNEASECVEALKIGLGINIQLVDESNIFLKKLAGISDPEKKRLIIGEEFIRSFEKTSKKIGNIDYLAQGTLYPDVIESGVSHGNTAQVIKSHHNVGGLPDDMEFELVEPLRELFKDEVRKVGIELDLPESLVYRHPFPGPGLAVRIMGEITKERIKTLQEADHIYIESLHEAGIYDEIWQAFSILIPVKTVGVMGDQRTYESLLGLRAVTSRDGMTADWYRMPPGVLSLISNRIVNSVKGINRVVYDVTSKPPGTIEWE